MAENIEAKIKAQADYVAKNGLPHFAPHSGKCYRCNRQIYERISLEKAGTELITGCPHCSYSYCD